MLIIEVMGGLGNQLQQYALYRKLKSLGKEVKLDTSWFYDEKKQENVLAKRRLELEYFENLPMEICTGQERERLTGGDGILGKVKRRLLPGSRQHFYESRMYHPEIFTFEDRYLTGFWACEKYYADILPLLRELIIFPGSGEGHEEENTDNKEKNSKKPENNVNTRNCRKKPEKTINTVFLNNDQTIRQMKKELSVSIHVRRGDYLDAENAAMFGGICTESYYKAAVSRIEEKCPGAHFYIFSDDAAYAKANYQGERYTVVDWNTGENSLYDIQLMSSCKHNICANSTFSFWGARLNPNPDKIMIRPARHKNSQQIIPAEMHELWKNWVLIDEKGRIV